MTMVPTIGHKGLAQYLALSTDYYMALGSGTSSEAADNTALSSEFVAGSLVRVSVTPTRTDNTLTFSNIFTSTTNYTITEAGIFESTNLIIRHLNSTEVFVVNAQQFKCIFTMSI